MKDSLFMQVLVHRRHHEEEASTSSYIKEGFGIPYFAGERDDEGVIQMHACTEKKRVFRFNKIHSIRDRDRSSPFVSLVRKLGRFKVRTVGVQDPPPNDNH